MTDKAPNEHGRRAGPAPLASDLAVKVPWGDLSPERHCLGVSLSLVAKIVGQTYDPMALRLARTPSDAVRILEGRGRPFLVRRPNGSLVDRLAIAIAAKRLRTPWKDYEHVRPPFLMLCQRSMRQLYGLPRLESHWVLITLADGEPTISDPLAEMLSAVTSINRTPPQVVIGQLGPNIGIEI